jgi:hypothetical protein
LPLDCISRPNVCTFDFCIKGRKERKNWKENFSAKLKVRKQKKNDFVTSKEMALDMEK